MFGIEGLWNYQSWLTLFYWYVCLFVAKTATLELMGQLTLDQAAFWPCNNKYSLEIKGESVLFICKEVLGL